tara:strand:+ start:711 stop:1493 length:783 start_codon:yes stop_codon:yes gene_type:complete
MKPLKRQHKSKQSKKIQDNNRKNERGNVLLYIFIAIALLAALSYAVSSGNRGGTAEISSERARLAASEILEYTNNISNAVSQLKLRGCTDVEINFDTPTSATDYSNPNAPVDNSCNIFHITGGGLQYVDPQSIWLDSTSSAEDFYGEYLFTGSSCVDFLGTGSAGCDGDGSDAAELTIIVPFLQLEICQQLNGLSGFEDVTAAPPAEADDAWTATPAFKGSYPAPEQISQGDNQKAGCFAGKSGSTPNGGYHFYKVLMAR